MTSRRRPSLASLVSNWGRSELPFWRRLVVALRNLSRRLAWPPRNCCGNYGQPGC
ncbi:MAG: hypothetical protein NZ695_02595 [Dehalococcoidia bacterium]|jgi:hypothetical protein|nr:hypothetical protein [Dehalococcoidia bacterium]MDW8008170.1 hypothetical protein [Chloroflexota bacterium]